MKPGMKYKFNLKVQALYGLVGFATALVILLLASGELNLVAAATVGACNFIVSGFYTQHAKKACRAGGSLGSPTQPKTDGK